MDFHRPPPAEVFWQQSPILSNGFFPCLIEMPGMPEMLVTQINKIPLDGDRFHSCKMYLTHEVWHLVSNYLISSSRASNYLQNNETETEAACRHVLVLIRLHSISCAVRLFLFSSRCVCCSRSPTYQPVAFGFDLVSYILMCSSSFWCWNSAERRTLRSRGDWMGNENGWLFHSKCAAAHHS